MSHQITKIDTVLRPAGSKYRTWHGIDTEVHEPITLPVARRYGVLPVVNKQALYVAGSDDAVENFKALTAVDKNGVKQTLDVVSDRYSIIQNEQVFRTTVWASEGSPVTTSPSSAIRPRISSESIRFLAHPR